MLLLNKRKLLDQLFRVVLNILKLNGITSACSDMIVTKVSGIEAFLSHAIKMSCYTHSFFLQTALVKYICGTFTPSVVFQTNIQVLQCEVSHAHECAGISVVKVLASRFVSLKTDAGRRL